MKLIGQVSLTCLAIVTIHAFAHAESDSEWKPRAMQKRTVMGLKLAKQGQDAVDALTLGAQRILDGNMKVHIYKKSGTYSTALQDFKLVNPASVTKFPLEGKNKGRIGTVGDRTIFLTKKGIAGRPTIRIMQHGHSESQKIVYMAD